QAYPSRRPPGSRRTAICSHGAAVGRDRDSAKGRGSGKAPATGEGPALVTGPVPPWPDSQTPATVTAPPALRTADGRRPAAATAPRGRPGGGRRSAVEG